MSMSQAGLISVTARQILLTICMLAALWVYLVQIKQVLLYKRQILLLKTAI